MLNENCIIVLLQYYNWNLLFIQYEDVIDINTI